MHPYCVSDFTSVVIELIPTNKSIYNGKIPQPRFYYYTVLQSAFINKKRLKFPTWIYKSARFRISLKREFLNSFLGGLFLQHEIWPNVVILTASAVHRPGDDVRTNCYICNNNRYIIILRRLTAILSHIKQNDYYVYLTCDIIDCVCT